MKWTCNRNKRLRFNRRAWGGGKKSFGRRKHWQEYDIKIYIKGTLHENVDCTGLLWNFFTSWPTTSFSRRIRHFYPKRKLWGNNTFKHAVHPIMGAQPSKTNGHTSWKSITTIRVCIWGQSVHYSHLQSVWLPVHYTNGAMSPNSFQILSTMELLSCREYETP